MNNSHQSSANQSQNNSIIHSSSNNVSYYTSNNNNLNEIYIPNCITSLGDDLFSNCADLSLLELPNYLTSIGENVFPNHDITIGYAKNSIDSRSWLNEQFTGTYNYMLQILMVIIHYYFIR
jgi:hypothetical protein